MTKTEITIAIAVENYNQKNFYEMVKGRKEGTTQETFMEDVQLWSDTLNSLPVYNEQKIREEIDAMDFDIPKDEYEFGILQEAYSRLVAYRYRIINLSTTINAHHDIFSKAYKSLKIEAAMLFSGTAKDKEANAETMVQPFLVGESKSDAFNKYILEVKEHIDFCSTTMARMLREKETSIKMNNGYNNEGMVNYLNKSPIYNDNKEIEEKEVLSQQQIIQEVEGVKVRKKIKY